SKTPSKVRRGPRSTSPSAPSSNLSQRLYPPRDCTSVTSTNIETPTGVAGSYPLTSARRRRVFWRLELRIRAGRRDRPGRSEIRTLLGHVGDHAQLHGHGHFLEYAPALLCLAVHDPHHVESGDV